MTRPPRKYLVVAVVAVVALLGGLLGPAVYGHFTNTSAKDRIEASPPPTLFADTEAAATVDPLVDPQAAKAAALMKQWWATHDTAAHDSAFVTWVGDTFPAPPATTRRTAELSGIEKLAGQRTADGVKAATWLEQFGKKDIWKLYAHDQAEWVPAAEGDRRKQDVKDMLDLSKKVADSLGTHFQQSAPYVLEPSLRRDHQVTSGQVCPCSYPSRHASAAASSRAYLAHFMPHRLADYRWMEDEIDYSRLYMAGHVPSDIRGGTLLGDMLAEYFLVTREGVAPGSA